MVAQPLLVVSHEVTGTATIRITQNSSSFNITIPEGTYWPDPNTAAAASDTDNLLGRVAHRISTSGSGDVELSASNSGLSYSGLYRLMLAAVGPTIDAEVQFLGGHANTTAAGRLILARLGFNPYATDPAAPPSPGFWFNDTDLIHGIWSPNRGEGGDVDTADKGRGTVRRSAGGYAYAFNLGNPLQSRKVTLRGVPGPLVVERAQSGGAYDYSFQRLVWRYLSRGSKLRYYADRTATARHLTAAASATADSFALSSVAGLAAGDELWVNGEPVRIRGLAGSTATVRRDPRRAVAHANYVPACTSFVGTYVLGDSGDVSLEGFRPERRAPNQDRWDFDLELLRSVA